MSLRAYKKNELKEMCQKLKLSDEGLKNDLEDRLQAYLDNADKAIEDLPELADHFIDLPISPSTARKAARKSLAILSDAESDLEGKASEMLKPFSQRLENAAQDMDISPSKVAQWADDTKKRIMDSQKLPTAITKTVPEKISNLRSSMSQVAVVAAISVIVEGAKMTKALVPISYEVKLGGLRSLTLPDFLVFLSVNNYWKPIATWLSFQLIPLAVSMVINLRSSADARKNTKGKSSEYTFDPFIFAISKLLMVYLAFHTPATVSYMSKQMTIVQYVVGLETFVIGTTITLLCAMYEAAL